MQTGGSRQDCEISKGHCYKPEKTDFGILQPLEYQIMKDLLEEKNKIVGYMTGVSICNTLGITTQVSNTIQIGINIERSREKRVNTIFISSVKRIPSQKKILIYFRYWML